MIRASAFAMLLLSLLMFGCSPSGQEPYYEGGKRATRLDGVFSDELWTSKLLELIKADKDSGKLAPAPDLIWWMRSAHSLEFEDFGQGNTFGFIGSDWAGGANGSLRWWKWFIGEGGIRVPLLVVPPKNETFTRSGQMTNEYAYVKELPMTILDYAGVDHPLSEFKGRALTPPFRCLSVALADRGSNSPRTDEEWVAFELFGNAYVVTDGGSNA